MINETVLKLHCTVFYIYKHIIMIIPIDILKLNLNTKIGYKA